MVRFVLFLLGTLTANRLGQREAAWYRADDPYDRKEPGTLQTGPRGPDDGVAWPDQPRPLPPWQARGADLADGERPGGRAGYPGPRRRRISPRVKRAAAIIVVGLIFRRAIASVVLAALSAALHIVGVNIHLPSIKFGWPWQTISASSATNTDLGPWVLQKIEGISKPALGQANFSFFFTHKVSKSVGPWPCWYASTFYAAGHAS
ncbi:MAG TPA: hypothetical protein VGA04_14960, partial [Streptosporangiaceae bacterium]